MNRCRNMIRKAKRKNSDRIKVRLEFLFSHKINKRSNRASDTDDSKDGSKSNADQMVGEDQSDADGHADVEQIEAVLCKSGAFCGNGI